MWSLWNRSPEQALDCPVRVPSCFCIVHRPGSLLTPVQKHNYCFTKHLSISVVCLKVIVSMILWVGWEELGQARQPTCPNRYPGSLQFSRRQERKSQLRKTSSFAVLYWDLWQSAYPSFCFTSFKLTGFKLDPYIFHEKDRGDIMWTASVPCSIIKGPSGAIELWSRNEVTLPMRTMGWHFYTPALKLRVSH